MPSVQVLNRQRKKSLDMQKWRSFAISALNAVLNLPRDESLPAEITIVFVTDSHIAEIHRDFMAIDSATDVITFQHGEIFISVETAERQANELGNTFDYELRLYLVHGLLHLAEYDDLTESGFKEMTQLQESLVCQLEQALG